jgi:hypothetical protein
MKKSVSTLILLCLALILIWRGVGAGNGWLRGARARFQRDMVATCEEWQRLPSSAASYEGFWLTPPQVAPVSARLNHRTPEPPESVPCLPIPYETVLDASVSPNERYLAALVTGALDTARGYGSPILFSDLLVFDHKTSSYRVYTFAPDVLPGQRYLTDLAWHPDGETLAVLGVLGVNSAGSEESGVYLVDVGTGAHILAAWGESLGGGMWGTQLGWDELGKTLRAHCGTESVARTCQLSTTAVRAIESMSPNTAQPLFRQRTVTTDDPFVPPTELTLEMYALTPSGLPREPAEWCEDEDVSDDCFMSCRPGDTRFGCTAFCDDAAYLCPYVDDDPPIIETYPYTQSIITIDFQTDYLLDVVPQELPPWYNATALKAQAVAARTYAFYHIDNPPTQIPYNNSVQFQAFVPLKFEAQYPPRISNNADDPCATTDLNEGQQAICAAVAAPDYMTHKNAPIRAEFASDAKKRTVSWVFDYLRGVDDPISAKCDANDFGHLRGMSQEGASRWGRGHECSYATAPVLDGNKPGLDWSAQFVTRDQILTHYYTGIDVVDVEGTRVAPNQRWNLLVVDWDTTGNVPPALTFPQSHSGVLWVQNTGTLTWTVETHAMLQTWTNGSHTFTTTTSLSREIVPGVSINLPVVVNSLSAPVSGDYTVKFEMAYKVGDAWVGFSTLEEGFTWPRYTTNVEVDIPPYIYYLPIVQVE